MSAAAIAVAALVVGAAPAAASPAGDVGPAAAALAGAGSLAPALFEKDGLVSTAAAVYRKSVDGAGCVLLSDLCASQDRAAGDPPALFTAAPGAPVELFCQLGSYFQLRFKDAASMPAAPMSRAGTPLYGPDTLVWTLKRNVVVTSTFNPVPCGLLDLSK